MTATSSGTATDYDDLMDKLKTFLTTAAALTGASPSQAWVVEDDDTTTVPNERHLYLRGPGLTASDTIYVNIRQYYDTVTSQYYNWELRGAIGYDSGEPFDNQPGVSPITADADRGSPRMLLDNSSMSYWFFASGRRFIVVAKTGTFYSTMYCGFYYPFGTPSEIPYPIFIGGTGCEETVELSDNNYLVGGFYDAPGGTTVPGKNGAYVRHMDGSWFAVANYTDTNTTVRSPETETCTWPYVYFDALETSGSGGRDIVSTENPDGSYTVLPIVLYSTKESGNVYGELEDVYYITGQGPNVSEDTLTIGGDTYLIIQTAYRTGNLDYVAIKQV